MNLIFYICILVVRFLYVESQNGNEKTMEAVNGVIRRLLGENHRLFIADLDKNLGPSNMDTFRITKDGDSVVSVTGSSGVAITWGFHYYLKNFCDCHVSWDGDQLTLPKQLPEVNITLTTNDKWRYYQNVVTSSYSFVWWDWKRWEREIDWMALNGINLALSFTAQEAIWDRVYTGLGLSDDEFTGPAFLAWGRMGNMRAFGGGLNLTWHESQIKLQHKILKRMRALGITPILPAFAGILPRSFAKAYPEAKITNMSKWNDFSENFCCPLLLDPSDPMFALISRTFLREYIEEFGTDHFYNCDTFNENTPSSDDPGYLASVSEATFNGINEVDPKGVWVLQGWMFIHPFWGKNQVKAYVSSVPKGKLLILDLQSDLTPQYSRFNSYYGQPFIWCMLHNFGGQLGMYGFLDLINKGVIQGRNFPNSTMVGVGIAPEGINQNYILYDFMLESSLRNKEVDLTKWVTHYSIRRYGVDNALVQKGWEILRKTVYSFPGWIKYRSISSTTGTHIAANVLVKRPSLRLSDSTWYNITDLYKAFYFFIEASDNQTLRDSFLFQHDFVDVTRQVIQVTVGHYYQNIVKSFRQRNVKTFQNLSVQFLKLFDSLEDVLATNRNFLLGTWLEGAKSCATNTNESIIYEYNARNQITLWGPKGEIADYAAKQWSGMIKSYYKPRWNVFLQYLNNSLVNNTKLNTTKMNLEMFRTVEEPFTFDRTKYPTEPIGDTYAAVNNFLNNFNHLFNSKNKNKDTILFLLELFLFMFDI